MYSSCTRTAICCTLLWAWQRRISAVAGEKGRDEPLKHLILLSSQAGNAGKHNGIKAHTLHDTRHLFSAAACTHSSLTMGCNGKRIWLPRLRSWSMTSSLSEVANGSSAHGASRGASEAHNTVWCEGLWGWLLSASVTDQAQRCSTHT